MSSTKAGEIAFHVRKRRAISHPETKRPADAPNGFAHLDLLAAKPCDPLEPSASKSTLEAPHTSPAREGLRTRAGTWQTRFKELQDPIRKGSNDASPRAPHATADDQNGPSLHQKGWAGNSLLMLCEGGSGGRQNTWRVEPTSFELHTPKLVKRQRSIGGRGGPLQLPQLEVRPSSIPHGGLGVFAMKDIKKGTWLTEYGGEIIDVEEARLRRECGDDTHIRSCGAMDRCIDARVRACWDVDYYVRHHMVGGFFNDAHSTGKPVNATYVTTEMRLGYQPPYPQAPWVSKRVFLRAVRDVAAGEELLVSYGTTYHALHFQNPSPASSSPRTASPVTPITRPSSS